MSLWCATKNKNYILATSSSRIPTENILFTENILSRKQPLLSSRRDGSSSSGEYNTKRAYLSDQKKPFDHFKPKSLLLIAARVVFVQAAAAVTSAMSDQLNLELERETLTKGDDAPPEEEQELDLEKCFKNFPHRCMNALLRLHATTLVMRWYEHMALSFFSIRTVDKLTKDPYLSAKRKYARNDEDRVKTGKQMFTGSLYASAIAVLSDFTVQQAILSFGYGLYCYRHILKLRARRRSVTGACSGSSTSSSIVSDDLGGGILLKFSLQSSSLLVSRTVAWLASSVGASIGTIILPGWGTIAGAQLFDGLAGSLFDFDISI